MDYGLLLSSAPQTAAEARSTQQNRLYAALRAAILDGRLVAGTRLPSTRTLSAELHVARNSVLHAYERLASEGFVTGTRQGTVVVRVGAEHVGSVPQAAGMPTMPRRLAGLQVLHGPGGVDEAPSFLTGTPALNEFPLAPWRRCVNRAWRHITAGQLGYAGPEGHSALRRAIADYLRVSRGVRCDSEQVFITDGSQSGLDLCARALADPGDTVWLENPGYHGCSRRFCCGWLAAGAH